MRIYPYSVLNGDVKLRIEKVALDGNSVIPAFIDEERRVIGIKAIGSTQWETLSFQVRVEGPSSELSGGSQWANVRAVATANCGRSNTRVTIPLQPKAGPMGRWAGSAELDRLDWFGSITISANILSTIEGIDNRLIGTADSWQISLDDLPRPPVGHAMTITWENFAEPAESSRTYLTRYAEEPFFVRIDPTNPVLFLNQEFPGLKGLLDDRKRRPAAEGALHDQLRGTIASETWFLLFIDALNHVEEVDGEVTWPEEEWRTHALQLLLEQIYGTNDLEALRRAYEAWAEPSSAAGLLELALPAAFAQGRMSRLLRRAIRAVPKKDGTFDTDDEEATL